MSKYTKVSVPEAGRTELHDQLGLTGAEISVNIMPAGAGVPFVHAHKENEEIYVILEGKGVMTLDGEDVELAAGDFLRVAPPVQRQMRAAQDCGIRFLCIQVKENSLGNYTMADAL